MGYAIQTDFPITLARTYDGGFTWELGGMLLILYPRSFTGLWIDQVDSLVWGAGFGYYPLDTGLSRSFSTSSEHLVAYSTNDGDHMDNT
jgi:hypothetical protein